MGMARVAVGICMLLFGFTARTVVSLGQCNSSGVLFNDDFDQSTTIQSTLWSSHRGVSLQTACTTSTTSAVLSNNVAVFGATAESSRYITSKAVSLGKARVIQFDAAACPWSGTTSLITAILEYSTNNGSTYEPLRSFTYVDSVHCSADCSFFGLPSGAILKSDVLLMFRVSKGGEGIHVVVNVTAYMRVLSTPFQFRVRQTSSFSGKRTQAWALDNFAVLGTGPEYIEDDFDSTTSSCHWLTHTGTIKPFKSSGNALTFSGNATSSAGHFASSIPILIPHGSVSRSIGILFDENFDPSPSIPGSKWASLQGGKVVIPDCGSIDSYGQGVAAFFSESGSRYIQTQPLDLTSAKTISFKIQIGGGGKCETADSGEDVVLEYQPLGSSAFTELRKMVYNEYTSAKDVVVSVPTSAATSSTVLRWRQLSNSGSQTDEWALDKIQVTDVISVSTTIFSERFDTVPSVPGLNWQSFSGGSFVAPDCGSISSVGFSSRAAFFSGPSTRSITTQALDLTNARSFTFRILLGGTSSSSCETVDSGEDVVVEYKQTGSSYTVLKTLAYDGYTTATQVSIVLPPAALTTGTTLRWRQLSNSGSSYDEWALDDITITGTGKTATITTYIINEDFYPTPSFPGTTWQSISGGSIKTPDCGSIDLAGYNSQAAFFSSSNNRYIQTVGLDLRSSSTLSFRIRIGGEGGCETADSGEDVVVEYKIGSSTTYAQLKRLASSGYAAAQTVSVTIPTNAKASSTVLRWRQLTHSGSALDEWAIDHVLLTKVEVGSYTQISVLSDNFDTAPSIPGPWWAAINGGTFKTPDCGSIDLVGYSTQAAFFSLAGTRYIQTQRLDLTLAESLSFRLLIGGTTGSVCEQAEAGEDVVVEYQPTGSSTFTQLLLLEYNQYQTARTVTVSLPAASLTSGTALKWSQKSHSGVDYDEWALDHVAITSKQKQEKTINIFSEDFDRRPQFPGTKWQLMSGGNITIPDCGSIDVSGYSAQAAFFSGDSSSRYIETVGLDLTTAKSVSFRLQIGGGGNCETADSGEDVVLEYRTSGATSFTRLQLLSYNSYSSSQTVSVSLVAASKTASTVLRWRQLAHSGKSYDEWAIDHIRITGTQRINSLYSLFEEDFYPIPSFPNNKWLSLTGGAVKTPDCGGIDLPGYSLQAAFFSLSGIRSIQTQDLDLRAAQTMSFVLQIGGTASTCEDADSGEDVVVEYRAEGSTSFLRITTFTYNAYRQATTVTVPLPLLSRTKATSLRWRQLAHSGSGTDEWAIDHIRVTGLPYDRQHVVNFQLFLGSQQSVNYDVRLEYSIDFGKKWALTQTDCLPSSLHCTQTLLNSQYQSVLFTAWRRLTVLVPFSAVSNNTQIRWRQPSTVNGNDWAIDDIYYGVQCPGFCSGHGRCSNTTGQYEGVVCGGNSDGQACASSFIYRNKTYTGCTRDGRETIDDELWCSTTANYDKDKKWGYCVCGMCQCDSGYSGKSCATVTKTLPRFLKEDFENSLSNSKWAWVGGGSMATTCGTVKSGKSMVFNVGRSRILETVDLDLTHSTTVKFTIRVGSSRSGCPQPSDNTENVFLQYSTNGGVTWILLLTIQYNASSSLKSYNLTFPNASKTASTRVRWYQPIASGSNLDVWAIDDVAIDSAASSLSCASSPCFNQGTCTNYPTTFHCSCVQGFTGKSCETNIDECSTNPCKNRAICHDLVNDYSCSCAQGFTGKSCETDIDECSTKPCKNGAICHNLVNDYSCSCVKGFTGKSCQTNINECSPNPCYNGATCHDLVSDYSCSCVQGYTGEICETDIDECSSSPCKRGGTCHDFVNGYSCSCPLGITGRRCDVNVNECLSGPCQNGGKCRDVSAGYVCTCRTFFTGSQCETQIPTCPSNPCLNGGKCSEQRDGGYTCMCPAGFRGINCEIQINYCAPKPCQNGATCLNLQTSYHCQCPVGYSGTNCSQYTGACGSSPCQNNGVCNDLPGGKFLCVCSLKFSGTFCQTPVKIDRCASSPCRNDATCQNTADGKFTCLCSPFYKGTLCEQQVNPCTYHNVTCSGRGKCMGNLATHTYVCQCLKGYTGLTCESLIDYCRLQQPCKNAGTCNKMIGGYSCACPQYYTGTTCETTVNPCDIHQSYCRNGGTCTGVAGTGNMQCQCPTGLRGQRCDSDYNECQKSGLCHNGGFCVNFFGGYQCVCPALATGQNCETSIPAQCSPNPCQNGGACAAASVNSYVCVCPPGFTDRQCRININECQSSPCQHGGLCVDKDNGYSCDCSGTTYEGTHCQTKTVVSTEGPNPCDTKNNANPCRNEGVCVGTGNTFYCVCATGYTGRLCDTQISDQCRSVVCGENEMCVSSSSPRGFTCVCSTGFRGSPCRPIQSSGCELSPCQNRGECTINPTTGLYQCQCMEGFTGSTCGQRVGSESSGSSTGDKNSDSFPMWIYVAAGVGGLIIVSLLIVGIFAYKRRQAHHQVKSPAPTNSNLVVRNPLYQHNVEGPPMTGSFHTGQVGRERVPASLRQLPAVPPVGGDFQTHNPMFGSDNPVFVPDTLQRPDLFVPYDGPPAIKNFPTVAEVTPFDEDALPSASTEEGIYDFIE